MKVFKKNSGFTLVELIVVIAILGILAAVAVPAYSGYIKKANDATVVSELGNFLTAAQAANASAGAITKIEVTSDCKYIFVYSDTVFASDFDTNLTRYYGGSIQAVGPMGNSYNTAIAVQVTLSEAISNWSKSSFVEDPDGTGPLYPGATWDGTS